MDTVSKEKLNGVKQKPSLLINLVTELPKVNKQAIIKIPSK